MRTSAQVAHGEYDMYSDTNLKHRRTCTGHRHCLVHEKFYFLFQSDGVHAVLSYVLVSGLETSFETTVF
jgi:hypothetical protein